MTLRLEQALKLLGKARDDRYILERAADDPHAPVWPLGFHAQQAVEKAIKAVLAAHSIEYPLTHNIAALLDRLAKAGFDAPPDGTTLAALTPFGVALRYDDIADTEGAILDRVWARQCVNRTIQWAQDHLTGFGGA